MEVPDDDRHAHSHLDLAGGAASRRWCVGGGLLGAAQGLAVLAWSPQVSEYRFSYPFDVFWYVTAEMSFFLQHLLPVMLIGVGLTVAGVALLRHGTAGWTRARWLPAAVLAAGVYVFMALTPAINGSFTAGRLGIGGWMLLFAGLGYGPTRLEHRDV